MAPPSRDAPRALSLAGSNDNDTPPPFPGQSGAGSWPAVLLRGCCPLLGLTRLPWPVPNGLHGRRLVELETGLWSIAAPRTIAGCQKAAAGRADGWMAGWLAADGHLWCRGASCSARPRRPGRACGAFRSSSAGSSLAVSSPPLVAAELGLPG